MPRPSRIDYAGAWHHVMQWSPAQRPVFPSCQHRWQFLQLLGEIHHEFAIEVHAYCLLEDGYHLFVRSPRANLSRAMRHLNGVYTQTHNRLLHTDGPLFRGRFKSVVVEGDAYGGAVTRYIHCMPSDTALVQRPEDYPHSSYPAYLGGVSAPDWLHTEETLILFGGKHRREAYRSFIAAGVDEELRRFYAQRRVSPVLGSPVFSQRIAELGAGRDAEGTADGEAGPKRREIDAIIAATAGYFGVEARQLRSGRHGKRNQPRAIAMALCHQPGGHSLAEVAKAFGAGSQTSVSMAIYRLKARLRVEPELQGHLMTLRERLGVVKEVESRTP